MSRVALALSRTRSPASTLRRVQESRQPVRTKDPPDGPMRTAAQKTKNERGERRKKALLPPATLTRTRASIVLPRITGSRSPGIIISVTILYSLRVSGIL